MSNLPKPVLILLAVSLALNLFFVGIWAGRRWSGRDRGLDAERFGVNAFLHRSGLGDAGPAVQQIIRAQRATIRQRALEMSAAREAVRVALQAEPFDRGRLETTIQTLETTMSSMQRDMHGALMQVAGAVDVQHRARMAEALWPRPGFGHRGPRF